MDYELEVLKLQNKWHHILGHEPKWEDIFKDNGCLWDKEEEEEEEEPC